MQQVEKFFHKLCVCFIHSKFSPDTNWSALRTMYGMLMYIDKLDLESKVLLAS